MLQPIAALFGHGPLILADRTFQSFALAGPSTKPVTKVPDIDDPESDKEQTPPQTSKAMSKAVNASPASLILIKYLPILTYNIVATLSEEKW